MKCDGRTSRENVSETNVDSELFYVLRDKRRDIRRCNDTRGGRDENKNGTEQNMRVRGACACVRYPLCVSAVSVRARKRFAQTYFIT